MEILVCVKRVPDTAENEVRVNMEDAIQMGVMDGKMEAMGLTEFIAQHIT